MFEGGEGLLLLLLLLCFFFSFLVFVCVWFLFYFFQGWILDILNSKLWGRFIQCDYNSSSSFSFLDEFSGFQVILGGGFIF